MFETSTGLATIRSMSSQSSFIETHFLHITQLSKINYMYICGKVWLSLRTTIFVGDVLIGFASFLCVYTGVDAAIAGFIFSRVVVLATEEYRNMLLLLDIESSFSSVERLLHYYTGIEREWQPEKTRESITSEELQGKIEIVNYSMRYRNDTPIVLRNINVEFKQGEKSMLEIDSN